MCQAIREMVQDGWKNGWKTGWNKVEGQEHYIYELICYNRLRGVSDMEIADFLQMDISEYLEKQEKVELEKEESENEGQKKERPEKEESEKGGYNLCAAIDGMVKAGERDGEKRGVDKAKQLHFFLLGDNR